jgi:hypothetical protein
MKREQIKELKGMISQAVADDRMSQSCAVEIMDKLDAILALPLDVPSEDEVKKHMIEMNLYQHLDEFDNDVWDEGKLHWAIVGYRIASKWMKEEIIKRNK